MFFNSLVNIVGVLCVPFFHFIGRKGIRDYWTLQRIKGNKFDVKYSLFRNMLYPDCNELDPFFIIRTIYQYRYQNPTQYPHFYTNQTYVVGDTCQAHLHTHILPANYPISISGTLSTTIFCHRGHYFFSLSPTESCFPLTFTRAPRARWGTRRMPIVMFLCDEGVSAATTFVAKKHPQ